MTKKKWGKTPSKTIWKGGIRNGLGRRRCRTSIVEETTEMKSYTETTNTEGNNNGGSEDRNQTNEEKQSSEICNITKEMSQSTKADTTTWLLKVIYLQSLDDREIVRGLEKGSYHTYRQERNQERLRQLQRNIIIKCAQVPRKIPDWVNRSKEVFGENQCGFRPGKGFSDQISIIRQVIAKKSEFQWGTVFLFHRPQTSLWLKFENWSLGNFWKRSMDYRNST